MSASERVFSIVVMTWVSLADGSTGPRPLRPSWSWACYRRTGARNQHPGAPLPRLRIAWAAYRAPPAASVAQSVATIRPGSSRSARLPTS